jgi:hypothetical protein
VLRCSFAAEARGDAQFATAAPAAGFLLLEQPGGWGRNALTESRLDPEVAAEIGARALAAFVRVLLIRRHGRTSPAPNRRWALADAAPGRERLLTGTFADEAELLDLPLDGSAGEAVDGAWYLVCTHGRHDACCALRGRPVAAALHRLRPETTWECSHVGGDRFAGNVVVLPHGLYYGRVGPADAAALVAAHESGRVAPSLLRGRAAYRPPVQAAQHFARAELGALGIDDLAPLGNAEEHDGVTVVRLAHGGRVVTVAMRHTFGDEAALLTCHATHPLHPPGWELEAIDTGA